MKVGTTRYVEQLRPTVEPVELMNPIILLITDTNADLLSAEFGRYSRDYDIRLARSASEATTSTPRSNSQLEAASRRSAVSSTGSPADTGPFDR